MYEPPAIPQQLRTPFEFEISFTTGHEQRFNVASAKTPLVLVAHEHVRTPFTTEHCPHVEV